MFLSNIVVSGVLGESTEPGMHRLHSVMHVISVFMFIFQSSMIRFRVSCFSIPLAAESICSLFPSGDKFRP